MFWVRKKLMTYQEIEPRPLAALQAFCQLQSRVAATHSLQLWREEGREREGRRPVYGCIQGNLGKASL